MNILTAAEENGKTLAALLGIDEGEATELLNLTVLISADTDDSAALFMAQRLVEILSRTVSCVTPTLQGCPKPSVEVVIGTRARSSSAAKIWVSISDSRILISDTILDGKKPSSVHKSFLILGACYTSAYVMKVAVGGLQLGHRGSIIIDEHELLGDDRFTLNNAVDIENTYLAGGGAIGNAFLYALRFFNVSGRLNIVDPKKVRDGNLNRCMFFNKADIGFQKAERLVQAAQPFFEKLELVGHNTVLNEVPERSHGSWLKRLIVAVDSRRARRTLQNEHPGEVFDASTTDYREVVFHHHRQPAVGACLSCIYHEEPLEHAHEKHVADVLGVSVSDVQSGFITDITAELICAKYPQLTPRELAGKAYDTLFKQLCGEGQLKTSEDLQVLAPFSFVSVLAGTYQAIELVRRIQKNVQGHEFNYWRLSPWASPQVRLRSMRPRLSGCEFCGDEVQKKVTELLWGGKSRHPTHR